MKSQVKIPRMLSVSQGKIPAIFFFILILTGFFNSPIFPQEATDGSLTEVSDAKKNSEYIVHDHQTNDVD